MIPAAGAASHVCPPLSFRPRTHGEWLLNSSLIGQTARVDALQLAQPRPTSTRLWFGPAADPRSVVCSSRITYESVLEPDPMASKAGPVMQVEAHCTAQHIRAAAYTLRPPDPGRIDAGPKQRAGTQGALGGDSDGVTVTYQEARDLLASVFCPHTKGRFSSDHSMSKLHLQAG
jgi:hypothetical protein